MKVYVRIMNILLCGIIMQGFALRGSDVLEPSDKELRAFGERCYELSVPLWIRVLDFLLGEFPVLSYKVDPSIARGWTHNQHINISDEGWLTGSYGAQLYTWSPYSGSRWHTMRIPSDYTFERVQGRSIVLMNNQTKHIRTLDDRSFETVADYKINAHQMYYQVGGKGRVLVCGAHPAVFKSPIYKLFFMRAQQPTISRRFCQVGVMPPFAIDETGRYSAALATEYHSVYVFDCEKKRKDDLVPLELSRRSLPHPQEYMPLTRNFRWVLRDSGSKAMSTVTVSRTHLASGAVQFLVKPIDYRKQYKNEIEYEVHSIASGRQRENRVIHLAFAQGDSDRPVVVSVMQGFDPSDATKNRADATYWDGVLGVECYSYTSTCSVDRVFVAGTSARGRLLLFREGGYCCIDPGKNPRVVIPQAPDCNMKKILVSPQGYWAVLCQQQNNISARASCTLPLTVLYFGLERMYRMPDEDITKGYRTFAMRLYALHRMAELGTWVQPSHAFQRALGMEQPRRTPCRSCIVQ